MIVPRRTLGIEGFGCYASDSEGFAFGSLEEANGHDDIRLAMVNLFAFRYIAYQFHDDLLVHRVSKRMACSSQREAGSMLSTIGVVSLPSASAAHVCHLLQCDQRELLNAEVRLLQSVVPQPLQDLTSH